MAHNGLSFEYDQYNPHHKYLAEYVLNHKSVFENIIPDNSGIKYIDINLLADNDNNMIYVLVGGLILFNRLPSGEWEIHIHFLPQMRGKHAISGAISAIEQFFQSTQVDRIMYKIPDFNKASKVYAAKIGGKRTHYKPNEWVKNGVSYGVQYYELEAGKWAV